MSAAKPATWGAAIEVPLRKAKSSFGKLEKMFTTARRSRGCFLQLPLFGVDALTRAVAARGLADHPIGLSWEPLDREWLMPPVAYSRIESLASALHLTALEEESLILRDEHGYLEWEGNALTHLYAHWQLLSAARLEATLRAALH